jgi:broad specificity phosphatase PhoE
MGRTQAHALAAALAGEPLAAVCSSPLERAMETAHIIAAPHGLQPRPLEDFIELDLGDWTGRTIASLAGDATWHAFNTVRGTTRIPNGENVQEVQARALDGIAQLHRRYGDATVAVVTHGDVIRALLTCVLGMPVDFMLRLTVEPASISTLVAGDGAPSVFDVNRRIHPV